MAIQVYNKVFSAKGNLFYDNKDDIRKKALKQINEFFIKYQSLDIINIIENWNSDGDFLQIVVYYKDFI